jgi:hypothetical protein
MFMGIQTLRANNWQARDSWFQNAPHDWLAPGKRFTLFEGELPLAEGVVV